MAVYKIFAESDATMYSSYPAKNTGLDEVLEVSVKNSEGANDPNVTGSLTYEDVRRSVLKFSDIDLAKIKTFATGSWKSNLRLYLANAENLNANYYVEVRQLSQSYDMGTGQFGDSPETTNGVCWYSTSSYYTTASSWNMSHGQYYTIQGGGSWTNLIATQSFNNASDKDINCDVSNIVNSWFSGSKNHGLIVKHPSSIESSPSSYKILNYFSVDTHTIYPPTLEIMWDDSVYATGSLQVVSNDEFVISIPNNTYTYKTGTDYLFKVVARDKYPTRRFTTSSIYLYSKLLPRTSYWAIQDVKTEDMIVDFDENYTKLSANGSENFFKLYMGGLEPERFYKILIKTVLSSGETIEVDGDHLFKLTR